MTFFLRLYRYLFVMPWRGVMFNTFRRFDPARRFKPPLPHPVDDQYGIDTSGSIFGAALRSSNSTADLYSTGYAGSQPSIIRKILRLIPNLETFALVDIGCGKGRVLAVASEFPLREIIGVELSPKLAAIARANAAIMNERFSERTPITVIEGDAAQTLLPEGDVVVYLCNPFFKKLMKRVVTNIENTLAANPSKKIYVIYGNPVYGELFDASPRFSRFFAANMPYDEAEQGTGTQLSDTDDTYVIWQSMNAPLAPPHQNAEARIYVTYTGWRVRVEE